MPEINMIFTKRPSGAVGVAKGLWNRKSVGQYRKRPWEISAFLRNVCPAPSHIRAFNTLCGVPESDYLHPLYPLTHVYPLTVRILSHRKSGFDIFKSLNLRSTIHQMRKIAVHERLCIRCSIRERRVVAKGMELDVETTMTADEQPVWSSVFTFFCRGRFGEPIGIEPEDRLRPLPEIHDTCEWLLKRGQGFRFARVSGDTNGIHYSNVYARMFGFKGAFAQPVLVIARTLQAMGMTDLRGFILEQRLKGPVYYNNRIIVKNDVGDIHDGRFDIFCGENPRPCIQCGIEREA